MSTKLETKKDQPLTLRGLLSSDTVRRRFQEVLGKEAAVFSASIANVVNGSKALQECSPSSILNAAFQAAALKLPITPGLGQAAIVPYKGVAQFQIMTRGIIQLAHRSGQYKKMNLAEVHEGELIEFNEFTGEVNLDAKARKSDKVIGYFFFFELTNGYRHESYWSVERCIAHGKKYSQAFKAGRGPWVDNQEAMCKKTPVKNEIAKWGPMSSDMRTAFTLDQAAIKDDGSPEYIDATATHEGEDAGFKMPAPKALATPTTTAEPEKPPKPAEAVQQAEGVKTERGIPEKVTKYDGGFNIYLLSSPGVKFYTTEQSIADAAKLAKEQGREIELAYEDTKDGHIVSEVRLLDSVKA